jgi:23S rRNA pseudouridine2605 synthase
MPSERLSKFLSNSGIASRRKCDTIIASGRVKVNNTVILEPFFKVIPTEDNITVDNVKVIASNRSIYLAFYKPINVISDLTTDRDRQNARSLIPVTGYIFPVGRLDYNSEGLMLFTNDGDFASRIIHPKYNIEKEYLVKFKGLLSDQILIQIKHGLLIDGSVHKIKTISFIKTSFSNSWYRIILTEGKNRTIRKIGSKVKHPVLKIKRIRIGPVRLGNMKPGQCRPLKDKEKVFFLKNPQP